MEELDFFEIVKIADNEDTRRLGIANLEGVLLGKAREDERDDGAVVGYGVSISGINYAVGPCDIQTTGRKADPADFYTGESIRVSGTGELLPPIDDGGDE